MLEFEIQPTPMIESELEDVVLGAVRDHRLLTHRDEAEQHPMSAITGLTYALSEKQPTIDDLSTIRSGAALGATAYQKPASGVPKSDFDSAVQASLDLADSALQAHQSLAAYRTSAAQDAIDINGTKLFVLSSTSDLVNAQKAYDWWKSGGNPVIRLNDDVYYLSSYEIFRCPEFSSMPIRADYNNATELTWKKLILISNDYINVNNIQANNVITDYLNPFKNYSAPYTPQYNGSPATKKYVDDHHDPTKVSVAQGAAHAGEFLVVGADGNVTTQALAVWQGG